MVRGLCSRRGACVVFATIAPALLGILLIGLIIGEWWHLTGYFWYFFPGNVLPQEPAVMYAGTIYHPGFVVLLFSLSTMTASFIDYFTITKLLKFRRFAPLKRTSLYQAAVRCFYWRPWWTIVVFAFTPLPFFPVRVVALGSGYPLVSYVSANIVGRVPRYYLLAIGGAWLTIPLMYVLLAGLALGLIPSLVMLLARRRTVQAVGTAA